MEAELEEEPVSEDDRTFVVVDSNNNWLEFTIASTPQQAFETAENSSAFNPSATIYVYEIRREWITKTDDATILGEIGLCRICGDEITKDEEYIEVEEGTYVHKKCRERLKDLVEA